MSAAKDVYSSPISTEKKQAAIKQMGLEYKQVEYEVIKSLNDTEQAQYMAQSLEKATDDQIKDWVKNEVLTTNVVSKMAKQGTITEIEEEALKELIDPKKDKTIYTDAALTGDPSIDKAIKSKKIGELTTKKNDIIEDYAKGKITAEQAKVEIEKIDAVVKSFGSGGRKLNIGASKKIQLSRPQSYKSQSIKFTTPTMQKINLKLPSIKLSSAKRRIQIKKPIIKKLTLKKKR